MDSDHVEDSANETGHKIAETAARALGDHAAGAERVAGQIAEAGQAVYGQAKDKLRDAVGQAEPIKDYPLSTLLLAGAAGFVAGILFRRV